MKISFKRSLLASAIISTLAFSINIGTAQANTRPSTTNNASAERNNLQLLFVMSAKTGKITKTNGHYTLTLSHVDPHVLWFTDRPNRKAGFISVKNFLTTWSNGFKKDAPNGALIHVDMEAKLAGKNQPMAMELSNPIQKHGQLSFTVNNLSGDSVKIDKLSNVRLFFDGLHCHCGQLCSGHDGAGHKSKGPTYCY